MDFESWLVKNGKMKIINGVPCSNLSKEDILEFEEWQLNQCIQHVRQDKARQITGYLHWKYLLYYTSLQGNVDINKEVDERGFTPLMVACEYGFLDLIHRISAFPNVELNRKHKTFEDTALHKAAMCPGDSCIEACLEIPGFDWNIGNCEGRTPVMYATENVKSLKILEKILNNPDIMWNKKDKDGRSALIRVLMWKTKPRRAKCLKIMAKIPGIDWNIQYFNTSSNVMCPQIFAAMDAYKEVMEIMSNVPSVNWNIKLQGTFKEYDSVLYLALMEERYDFLRILFTLPNVEYDVKNLPKCKGTCCGLKGCARTGIPKQIFVKCMDICRNDHKQNGINYSDVVNFLHDAMNCSCV